MTRLLKALAIIGVPMLLLLVVVSQAPGDEVATGFLRPLRIVFMSDRDGNFESYLMESDGAGQLNLSNHEAGDGLAAWSRQANAYVFVSTRDTNLPLLYTMQADGSSQALLHADHPSDIGVPTWSPTGEWIAFGSQGTADAEIYLIDPEGETVRNLTQNPAQDRFGGWSPDGRQIAFTSDRDGETVIYAMSVQDGETVRLTELDSSSILPAWSPDGASIAFVSNRDDDIDIYVMDADGANVARLTDSPGLDAFPAWSPDGSKIAFVTDRDGNPEIYVMNADGSEQANLTNHPAQESVQGDFAWSPDGSQILFHSDRDGNVEVYVMDADGSNQTNVSGNLATDFGAVWVR